mmetsp:Transcript_45452/g.83167  ORF Transcript_45452/g.83167 Transcript_45452/m.83167 type:complete len:216 (+) Transcript_45452:128-775(+)
MVASETTESAAFARWRDSTNAHVDVQLAWHKDMPGQLPQDGLDPICTMTLCVPAQAPDHPQYFEARMQVHHLVGDRDVWTPTQLQRLMTAMEQAGGAGSDTVQLRREMTRVVIDVVFRDTSSATIAGDVSVNRKAVEILNAYPCATTVRGCTLKFLRVLAQGQQTKLDQVTKAKTEVEDLRKVVQDLETREAKAAKEKYTSVRDYPIVDSPLNSI